MSVLYNTIFVEPDYRRAFEQEMRRMLQEAIQEAKRKLLRKDRPMTDRDYEIELSALRAELATVKADRDDWRDAIRLMIGMDTNTPWPDVRQSDVDGWLERIRQLKKGG